ncbi:MAG: HlyD family secretion protein [Novosphingobium sp.]
MAERDPLLEAAVEAARPLTRKRRNFVKYAAMAAVPLLLIVAAVWYFLANDRYVSTDNAYVRQDKVSVSSQVGGDIVEVGVRENQRVRAGDLLFRIDPEPFRIAIAQADAALASAQVKVVGLQTELGSTGADVKGTAEDVGYFEDQLRRESALMQRGFTTRARLESAQHDLSDARSKLAEAQGKANEARAALATAAVAPGINPGVLAALAQRRKAELDLKRSVVRAPVGGTVSQASSLQIGELMMTGLPAVTIVASDGGWVEANFKETELARMRVGQPAKLTFDAYPGIAVKAHVASIGAGTGSEFSVLPAQNANGNWIKVTQRVPVRLAIDEKPKRPLIAGLSTHVVVDTGK